MKNENDSIQLSKYVRVIFVKNHALLFNTINSCIVEVETTKNCNLLFQGLSTSEIKYLKENDFFIDDKKAIEIFLEDSLSKTLNITISLTEQCNLQCRYCYENNLMFRAVMSFQTIDKIIQYIQNIINSNMHIELVSFDLIGGEPLLAIDKIEYLIAKIQSILNINTHYLIETNGTLFTDQVQKIFEDINLTVQITLTTPSDHNRMRPFKGGAPSYKIILQNLKNAYDFFVKAHHKLILRYNVNKSNIENFDSYITILKKSLHYPFSIELAPVINYSYNDYCDVLSSDDYSKWFLSKYFSITENAYSKERFLLSPKRRKPCMAYEPYNVKIHADGSLALCNAWVSDNRMGNIDMLLAGHKKEDIFLQYNLKKTLDHNCMICANLFLCGGKRLCFNNNPCHFVDFDIDTYIKLYAKECADTYLETNI